MSSKTYVVVLPNGQEYYGVVGPFDFKDKDFLCKVALSTFKYTTTRKERKSFKVKVYLLSICSGVLERVNMEKISVIPPIPPMTYEDRNQEAYELLIDIPLEFHYSILNLCYESFSIYEEQIEFLENIVNRFKEPFEKYTNRIKQE